MSTAYALRAGNSGPVFGGNNGDVLTLGADGKASFEPATSGGDHKVAVTGSDTTPDYLNAKVSAGDGIELAVLNPGADEVLEISTPGAPSFPIEDNAGNVTGAQGISVADHLARFFTLTGNATLTVNGLVAGRSQWFQFRVIQGGAGSFSLSIVGAKTPGGLGLLLSTAIGANDLVSGFWNGSEIYAQVVGLAFS